MTEPLPSTAPSADTTGPSGPPSIEGYELLRAIGRGSYGEVWLARDAGGEYRAVKVVHRKTFEHDRPFERELSGIQKFEPVSRTHPSQVSILQVGRNQEAGYFYYVMELADDAGEESGKAGKRENERNAAAASPALPLSRLPAFSPATYVPRTLKLDLQRRHRLPFQECLAISLALTTALDHLHQHGLIHRDIKPSNVIFVRGVPKLADIGLVTDVGATISHVGTEGFLPPEGPGTPQADLYSLGKVLYEICTGHDRLDFPELPTFVEQAAEKENLLELNQVFLKACQNDPRQRYQSAREMFSDLALLQSGKSLRRARTLEQRLAKVRRGAAVAITLAVAAALANHLVQRQQIKAVQRESDLKERDKQVAQRTATEKSRSLADAYVANGDALIKQGDFTGALVWFSQALHDEQADPARLTPHRRRLETWLARCPKLPVVFTHRGAVISANLSADGRRLVTAGDDQTAQVWNTGKGEPIGQPLTHSAPVQHAELNADGARALTLARGVVQVWTGLDRSAFAMTLQHTGTMKMAGFSPDGRQILTVTGGATALIWEAGSGQLRFTIGTPGTVLAAVFSPDGRFLATSGADGSARVWSSGNGEAISPLLLQDGPVTGLAFSANGRRLLTFGGERCRVWDARSGDPASVALRHDAAIRSADFSPDGRWIVTAGDDLVARVWDAVNGKLNSRPLQHEAPVQSAGFSPDGHFIATASGHRVHLWNALTGELLPPVIVCQGRAQEVHFSPDGDRLVIASTDGSVRIVEVEPSSWRWFPPTTASGDDEALHWAQLLAGREISSAQQLEPVSAGRLRQLWSMLKTNSPTDFAPADPLAWHRAAGEVCEKAGQWFGARFHWQRALAARPGDSTLLARRDRAATEFARGDAAAARSPELPRRLPARSDAADARLLDLSAHYNAALTDTWLPTNIVASGNDLADLPRGVQKFGGVEFDVRGLIQLSGSALENLGRRFPQEVSGLRVGRPGRRLHFLHGAAFSALAGTHLGSYRLHYADGDSREVRIVFGQNVSEWWGPATQPPLTAGAAVAWIGGNAATRGLGLSVRIYQMTWLNPRPDVPIASIDFQSTSERSAPFLIAITAE